MKITAARHGESEGDVGRWIVNRGRAYPRAATSARLRTEDLDVCGTVVGG